MTRETRVRPPGVPTHGPPHLLHKRLTILELLRSLPINHKFSCFLWDESIHKHLLKSPSRACSAILHPIYFIKGLISGKLFRFSSLNLYNDVSDDKIHSMSLIVMSHEHWGGLGDFIISRLQSYIPFLMKMLKMSTFGKLVLIDNWNNIIYFFWTFAGKEYLMAGFCLNKIWIIFLQIKVNEITFSSWNCSKGQYSEN